MTREQDLFTEQEAIVVWNRFFTQVGEIGRLLSERQRQDLLHEIQDHLYESYGRQPGDSELARLELAIKNIGNPEEFVRPLVADHLLTNASRTMNPRSVILGLVYNMSRGVKAVSVSALFGLGYMISLGLLLVAVSKPFKPEGTGLFAYPNGGYGLGMFDSYPEGATELMGYWIVPVCLLLSVAVYWGLTRLLRLRRAGGLGSGEG